MFWSVDQRSLHRCRLDLEDESLERASLFPFFDDRGRTRAAMLTTAESSRILMFDWHPQLFVRGWRRRHRLRARFTDLRDCEPSDVERFAHLWHFDPWWVLGDDRYVVHSAVPILRRTNLPGYDRSLSRMWFDRRLGRVLYVASGRGESTELQSFKKSSLAEATGARREAPSASHGDWTEAEWRLRPFWG